MRIKQVIKKILPRRILDLIRDIVYPEKIGILEDRLNTLFLTYYQSVAAPDLSQKTAFRNAEFKIHSKHGCDGLLAYIFSKIGATNRTFVEIGVEDGRECNTADLSLNLGWQGLLIDGNEEWVNSAKDYYKEKLGNQAEKVKIVTCFVTAENINQLLIDKGFRDEIDLLSIDIDSNDYWLWRAIKVINPRVVVVEYNAAFGLRPITIKYNSSPDFHYRKERLYFGASVSALTNLAKEKGYILVACDCHGHDAYFIRKDAVKGKFVELFPEKAFYPNPLTIATIGSIEDQFERIKHMDFEEV